MFLLKQLGRGLCAGPSLPWARCEADAIVVLGGHPRVRIPAAVALWQDGVAEKIVVVGGHLWDGRPGEVWRGEAALREHGVPDSAVASIEEAAPGTVEEARVVVARARLEGWQRLVVVTSPYHRWRSRRVFAQQAVPVGIDVHIEATPFDDWDPDAWWTDPRQRRLVTAELAKFATWKSGVRPGLKALERRWMGIR